MGADYLYMGQKNNILKKTIFIFTALVLGFAWLVPLTTGSADAAQITKRGLTISSGTPGASSVTYTIGASTGGSDPTNGFFLATSGVVKGFKIQACNTAVGTCSGTAGTDIPNLTAAASYTLTGWQDATVFTRSGVNQNDCNGTTSSTIICLVRAGATVSENTTNSHKIVLTAITNPSNVNQTFFLRMTTYDNATFSISGGAGNQSFDTGTVASAVTQNLTIQAAVAEVLNFCVGNTTTDNATSSPAADCSAVSGTAVNIGTLDTSTVNISPVSTNGGNNSNGIAMLRTNAINGATVSYDAIQQSGTNHQGTLRVSGASCNAGNVSTDQCIDAQGGTQGTFTAGTEKFGMTIGGTNCGSVTPANYSCTYASGTEHLVPSSNYIGAAANAYGTTNGFAWVEGGTVTQIASSTTVVDDEALILKFAATPAITTPFGSYAAQADFIAVATY
jgi:hypothetical protein